MIPVVRSLSLVKVSKNFKESHFGSPLATSWHYFSQDVDQSPVLERRVPSSQETQEHRAGPDVNVRGRQRLMEEPHSDESGSQDLYQNLHRDTVNNRGVRILDTTTDSEEVSISCYWY